MRQNRLTDIIQPSNLQLKYQTKKSYSWILVFTKGIDFEKHLSLMCELRPVPNAAPLMCRTKLNTVRLWSDFGATADSDGVLASDLIREGHGKYFSMRKICDLNSLTLSK